MNEYVVTFVVFSCVGWIWESIYCTIKEQKWANRGFLYGPLCPIYGCGCVIVLAVSQMIDSGILPQLTTPQVFIAGFFVSMVLEYPTSWILEELFHARWWDYTDVPLNINGRTSVPTSLAFGVAAVLVMNVLMPICNDALAGIPDWLMNLLALVFVGVLSMDVTLTVSAITNFQRYVDSASDTFQNYMTGTVYDAFAKTNKLHERAVSRAVMFKLTSKKAEALHRLREERFKGLVQKYFESSAVRQMGHYIQHGTTTTLQHCRNVAWVSFLVNEKMHLNADEKELVEAAMLHDFYLYDWHDGEPERKTHGFDHPSIACSNAVKHFGICKRTQKAIKSHMWPLTITKIPRTREAVILCVADKYCAIVETIRRKKQDEQSAVQADPQMEMTAVQSCAEKQA